MHLILPLFLLLALAAATPGPKPAPPSDDGDTFCPEGTIPCGPVCVRVTQRCCNDPSTSEFWSCESTQTCGAVKREGCRTSSDQSSSSSSSPPGTSASTSISTSRPPSTRSHFPGHDPDHPTTTASFTETQTRTLKTRLSSFARPASTSANQPPTCFFEVPVVRRVSPEQKEKETPCPTSLVSSSTPTEVPPKSGMAVRGRSWGVAAVVGAAAGVVALLV